MYTVLCHLLCSRITIIGYFGPGGFITVFSIKQSFDLCNFWRLFLNCFNNTQECLQRGIEYGNIIHQYCNICTNKSMCIAEYSLNKDTFACRTKQKIANTKWRLLTNFRIFVSVSASLYPLDFSYYF